MMDEVRQAERVEAEPRAATGEAERGLQKVAVLLFVLLLFSAPLLVDLALRLQNALSGG